MAHTKASVSQWFVQLLKKRKLQMSLVFIVSDGRARERCAPNHRIYCAATHTPKLKNSGRFLNFKNVLNSLKKVGAQIGIESYAGDVWQKMRRTEQKKLILRPRKGHKEVEKVWFSFGNTLIF